jgi:hypothetical protein
MSPVTENFNAKIGSEGIVNRKDASTDPDILLKFRIIQKHEQHQDYCNYQCNYQVGIVTQR